MGKSEEVVQLEWHHSVCGAVSEHVVDGDKDYPEGSEKPCVLCSASPEAPCVAKVRRKLPS